jgi:hypothetical protein
MLLACDRDEDGTGSISPGRARKYQINFSKDDVLETDDQYSLGFRLHFAQLHIPRHYVGSTDAVLQEDPTPKARLNARGIGKDHPMVKSLILP